jgi:hypothetical protein
MSVRHLLASSAMLCALSAVSAQAATFIDFSDLPSGRIEGSIVYEGAVFTSASGVFSIIDSYYETSSRICAFGDVFTGCSADWTVTFKAPVADVSFRAEGWRDPELARADLFDAAGGLLASGLVDANGVFDFSGISDVAMLAITSLNHRYHGMSYTDFSFTAAAAPAPVPLPAAAPMLAAALAGMGFAARRRRG